MSKALLKRSPGAGRPRSQALDEAIVEAATQLIECMPYGEVTIESIALKAGVSKATIYRRWPNKSAITVEVLLRQSLQMQVPFEAVSYREHLVTGMQGLREILSGVFAEAIVAVIAETQNNEVLRKIFYQAFISRMQAIGEADLEKAIQLGEARGDITKGMIFDQLFGTFYYRLLVVHKSIDDDYIERMVDSVIRQIS